MASTSDVQSVKTTKYCFSTSLPVNIPKIKAAKEFLSDYYGSSYTIAPHISVSTTPLPKYNLAKVKCVVDEYFSDKSRVYVSLLGVESDYEKRFFYIRVSDNIIGQWHKELIALVNKYRDGYIREKDAIRLQDGFYDQLEAANIQRYGYSRVYSEFTPHITLGNIAHQNVDLGTVKRRLTNMLEDVTNITLSIPCVLVTYHTDSVTQTNMRRIWEKHYTLIAQQD